MGNVGLLYVGAVLFMNGLMLLGKVEPRSAAVFNLFVGVLQVITPLVLVITANGDTNVILNASGLFLFAFTYLYVGIGVLGEFDTTGVGYFSLFVAIMALGYSYANFQVLNDRPFAVIWLYWAFLWFLFFLLLGLKREHLTVYTGWVTAIEGWVTGAIPAFLLLSGYWQRWNQSLIAIILVAFGVVVFGALWPRTRKQGMGPARGETVAARQAHR
ncbi:AmiS/UreI family transporter [Streptosporangium subroseum]|uniref:AmiS/UreI family transporter n=1 Tax=Streptosporangium subroseum TaxID=106412 RepID=A0A239BID1_9ACTN|nr:AmiS/UreI family transporter [Streptosporangium subroseum]SNS06874.1 AmiS/UreI family transporter [Streptosporangium subroseum]